MAALAEFDTTITLCFTPPSRGRRPDHTSPPIEPAEFADFAQQVVRRYVLGERAAGDAPHATSAPDDHVLVPRPAYVGATEAAGAASA